MDLEFIPFEQSKIYIKVESIGNLQSAWNLYGTSPLFPILHPLSQIYNLLSLIPYSYSHFPNSIILLILSIGPMPISLIPHSYYGSVWNGFTISLIPFKLSKIDINMGSIWNGSGINLIRTLHA